MLIGISISNMRYTHVHKIFQVENLVCIILGKFQIESTAIRKILLV